MMPRVTITTSSGMNDVAICPQNGEVTFDLSPAKCSTTAFGILHRRSVINEALCSLLSILALLIKRPRAEE
jgi:hypothetical protein